MHTDQRTVKATVCLAPLVGAGGGCPGHRELSGQATGMAQPPQLQPCLSPSLSQGHGRLPSRAAVTRGRRGPCQDTRQPFDQTPHRGWGCMGSFMEREMEGCAS
jgi:hypothetical protein